MRTVSATDMVSFRSLSSVATSCTICLSCSGGKADDEDIVNDRLLCLVMARIRREVNTPNRSVVDVLQINIDAFYGWCLWVAG